MNNLVACFLRIIFIAIIIVTFGCSAKSSRISLPVVDVHDLSRWSTISNKNGISRIIRNDMIMISSSGVESWIQKHKEFSKSNGLMATININALEGEFAELGIRKREMARTRSRTFYQANVGIRERGGKYYIAYYIIERRKPNEYVSTITFNTFAEFDSFPKENITLGISRVGKEVFFYADGYGHRKHTLTGVTDFITERCEIYSWSGNDGYAQGIFSNIKILYAPENNDSIVNEWFPMEKMNDELVERSLPLSTDHFLSEVTEKDDARKLSNGKQIVVGKKVKIGILEIQSLNQQARNEEFGKVFTEILTTSFVSSDAFQIIEREQLNKVLGEIKLTQSGIVDTSNVKLLGNMVGADAIVVGSITKLGDDLRLDIRIVDVESGLILTAEKIEGKTDIRNIGRMADSVVISLINRFYKP